MPILAFAIFWGLALYGFFHKEKYPLLYLLFGTFSFGSFAVISPALTGGLTFTAPPIILMMLIAKTFFTRNGDGQLLAYTFSKDKALFLFLFWVIAAFVTIVMPRYFVGEILVIPVRAEVMSYAVPLEPTTQNISQLMYLSISVMAVFSFAEMLKTPEMRQHALKAVCIGGLVAIITGLLDLLSSFIPLDFILDAFRNASYSLLITATVLGSKRIVGLMPEASAFGSVCMSFLTLIYFTRVAIADNFYREKLAPVLIFSLIAMLWLSTSSAAYVGLACFFFLAVLEWSWRFKQGQQNPLMKIGLKFQAWFLMLSSIIFLLVVLFNPSLFDPVVQMFESMVLDKTDSDSFEERSMWTAVSWHALLDSYGLGVGVGGTRASNGVVALVSNVGFVAATCYYFFLFQLFIKNAKKNDLVGGALISAAKWSFVPTFIIDVLVATTSDFGVVNAFRYGLILAIAHSVIPSNQKSSLHVGK